jgi:hypothetical protein
MLSHRASESQTTGLRFRLAKCRPRATYCRCPPPPPALLGPAMAADSNPVLRTGASTAESSDCLLPFRRATIAAPASRHCCIAAHTFVESKPTHNHLPLGPIMPTNADLLHLNGCKLALRAGPSHWAHHQLTPAAKLETPVGVFTPPGQVVWPAGQD